jgi:alpha-mannosidase
MAERSLIAAEVVGSLAHLIGAPAPPSLEDLWRVLLKNQFHDILAGSSIREVNEEAERELSEINEKGRDTQSEGMKALASQLPPSGEQDVVIVVNPSLSTRNAAVTLADGSYISSDLQTPPLGVCVFRKADLKPRSGLSASIHHLENDFLSVTIDSNGSITSLIHKETGREALAGRAASGSIRASEVAFNEVGSISRQTRFGFSKLSARNSLPIREFHWR